MLLTPHGCVLSMSRKRTPGRRHPHTRDSRPDDPLCGRPYVDKAVLAEALGDDPPPVARIAKEARPPRDPTLPSPAEMRKLAAREKKVCSPSTQQSISPTEASPALPFHCTGKAD